MFNAASSHAWNKEVWIWLENYGLLYHLNFSFFSEGPFMCCPQPDNSESQDCEEKSHANNHNHDDCMPCSKLLIMRHITAKTNLGSVPERGTPGTMSWLGLRATPLHVGRAGGGRAEQAACSQVTLVDGWLSAKMVGFEFCLLPLWVTCCDVRNNDLICRRRFTFDGIWVSNSGVWNLSL